MLYGKECWVVKKHVHNMSIAGIRMLRWIYGNTRKDRIRNKVIRKKIEVASIENKLREG